MSEYTLVLVRHGESQWNALNLFTGWVDVDLNEKGLKEAHRAGELMKAKNVLPDVLHTSLLRRAIKTANIALDVADRHWIPVNRNWRLNERHYGALQGKDKAQTLAEFGEEQFMLWRRSYDVPPPAIDPDNEFAQTYDPRYADICVAGLLQFEPVLRSIKDEPVTTQAGGNIRRPASGVSMHRYHRSLLRRPSAASCTHAIPQDGRAR